MKLTNAQRSLLCSELIEGHGQPFVMLSTSAQDRVAQNLASKGLGYYTNNGFRYSWRKRSGYTNNFTPNAQGLRLREQLKAKHHVN